MPIEVKNLKEEVIKNLQEVNGKFEDTMTDPNFKIV